MARARAPPFIGEVRDSAFLIRRDIRYRNSFVPRIRGTIRPSPGGTRVRLDMQLHPAVLLFALLWLGAAGSVFLVLLVAQGLRAALVPGVMFGFGVTLTAMGFYPEALRARRMLQRALLEP